jgi:hypothetical protein
MLALVATRNVHVQPRRTFGNMRPVQGREESQLTAFQASWKISWRSGRSDLAGAVAAVKIPLMRSAVLQLAGSAHGEADASAT